MKKALMLSENDNVATALENIFVNDNVEIKDSCKNFSCTIKSVSEISIGHKIAVKKIPAGDAIIKYGCVIGKATYPIALGERVHTHNLESLRGRGDLA